MEFQAPPFSGTGTEAHIARPMTMAPTTFGDQRQAPPVANRSSLPPPVGASFYPGFPPTSPGPGLLPAPAPPLQAPPTPTPPQLSDEEPDEETSEEWIVFVQSLNAQLREMGAEPVTKKEAMLLYKSMTGSGSTSSKARSKAPSDSPSPQQDSAGLPPPATKASGPKGPPPPIPARLSVLSSGGSPIAPSSITPAPSPPALPPRPHANQSNTSVSQTLVFEDISMAEVQAKLLSRKKKCIAMKTELRRTTQEITELRSALQLERLQRLELQKEMDDLRKSLETAQQNLEERVHEARSKATEDEKELNGLRYQLREAKIDQQRAATRIATLEREKEIVEKELMSRKHELEHLQQVPATNENSSFVSALQSTIEKLEVDLQRTAGERKADAERLQLEFERAIASARSEEAFERDKMLEREREAKKEVEAQLRAAEKRLRTMELEHQQKLGSLGDRMALEHQQELEKLRAELLRKREEASLSTPPPPPLSSSTPPPPSSPAPPPPPKPPVAPLVSSRASTAQPDGRASLMAAIRSDPSKILRRVSRQLGADLGKRKVEDEGNMLNIIAKALIARRQAITRDDEALGDEEEEEEESGW